MAGFQQLRVTRELDASGATLVGFNFAGLPGKVWHVDTYSGNDGNSGGEDRPLKTIQAALNKTDDLVVARNRGYHTILVHSGAYQETLTTPVNANAPFCQLIGMEARDVGSGCYLYPDTAGDSILTINARGWRISGFEFESATGAGIELTRDTDGTNRADYTQIDNCSFAASKYGIETVGSPYEVVVEHCKFHLMTTGAIYRTGNDSYANARNWTVRYNEFRENASHIYVPFNASMIYKNVFQSTGNAYSAKDVAIVKIAGGTIGLNIVSENVLGVGDGTTSGLYDESGGSCTAGTNDFWMGNWVGFAVNNKAPGSGS